MKSERVEALQSAMEAQHAKDAFSGVVLVRQGGETVLAEGFGLANRADGIPNTPETRFAIASGTKTFTAVAVGQLVERGLAGFDTRLAECAGVELPGFDPGITLHQLLTHSAGNPDYFDEEVQTDYEALWRERPAYAYRSPRDFLPLFQDLPMKFAPGERWSYSNAGYILLGLVVERLAGRRYTEYVEENVFRRAGMSDSGFFALDQLPERTAQGYIYEEGRGWKTNVYSVPIIGGADGGAYTTAPDTVKFWAALLGHRLLGQAATEAMLTPHWRTKPESDETHYGYGMWMTKAAGAIESYYMTGGDPGVEFVSEWFPAAEAQVTVLGNTELATGPMYRCVVECLKAG